MDAAVMNRYEIGSEYHWGGFPDGQCLQWPVPHIFLQTGRSALLTIWNYILKRPNSVLFVPDYFCSDVITSWSRNGIPVSFYYDNPLCDCPEWSSLKPKPGDVVLSVNYFGVRDGVVWDDWRGNNKDIILVEDHTHDPFSAWAVSSQADFAFASIRKIFPVSDGAIVWSPKKHDISYVPTAADWTGSTLKFAAMVLKNEYLNGAKWLEKSEIRELQMGGEHQLGCDNCSAITPWSKIVLCAGYPVEWRRRRAENVNQIFLQMEGHPTIKPLFSIPRSACCPFNAVFLFPSNESRNIARDALINNCIYPSIHWEPDWFFRGESRDLAEKILTIPVDQRYGLKDMINIVKHLG